MRSLRGYVGLGAGLWTVGLLAVWAIVLTVFAAMLWVYLQGPTAWVTAR